jgi:ribosomal protein S12 methylthiotransferase accessory factor
LVWSRIEGEPTRKVDRLLPRVQSLDESEAWVGACFDTVPITRLSDLTPLDSLGLPVFCAVTPLAKDLTTHLGKGTTALAARLSSLMEAIERVSAEEVRSPTVRASRREMRASGLAAIDPVLFDLPPGTRYRPDAPFDWVEGWDLIGASPVWLLADLARSPGKEAVLGQVDTNGLAAGNTFGEAVLHALCEVIERDALAQRQFFAAFAEPSDGAPPARRINPLSAPAATIELVERIAQAGLQLVVTDITGDVAIATFVCMLVDHGFPSPDGPATRRFVGYGCAPCAELALNRAICEAVQARLAVMQGARDSFNQTLVSRRAAGRWAMMEDFIALPEMPFATVPSFDSHDLARDLAHVLAALSNAGFGCAIVVDLTSPDLGTPVVRVRVPGLSSFVMDRARIGWRCLRYLL